LELQQQLAATQPRIPVIFISMHCDEDAQTQASRMGELKE
jgi:FixJ family two-component response regulator